MGPRKAKPKSRWAMMPAAQLNILVLEALKIHIGVDKGRKGENKLREIDALQAAIEKGAYGRIQKAAK